MRGEHSDVLPEALDGMQCARLRIPEELLPEALDTTAPELQRALAPVLGERGPWLAAQRAEWSWASAAGAKAELPPNADDLWSEGSAAERQRLLVLARQIAPERGRRWVESTFRADKPEQRQLWLRTLEVGLSMDDAPFLEQVANDRSALVRATAARVAWRLPETPVAQAVWERIASLVSPGPAPSIALPPEPFDRALEKLGILETPPEGVGRRQWWLAQLLSAVDPARLSERLGVTTEALVAAIPRHDLGLVLLNGLTSAALRFEARAAYAPLWDAWMGAEGAEAWFEPEPLERLTRRLSAEERESRLLRCLKERRDLALLAFLPRPWPASIARELFAQLRAGGAHLASVLPIAGPRLPLELVPDEPAALLPERCPSTTFARNFDDFVEVIRLRRRLLRELQP